MAGIRLLAQPDTLIWTHDCTGGNASANSVYNFIVLASQPQPADRVQYMIWLSSLPSKIAYFIWLVLGNRILTWDNLQRKGWSGPGICSLCGAGADCILHIFSFCPVWRDVIYHLSDKYHFIPPQLCDDIPSYIRNWICSFSKYTPVCYIIFFALWIIWKARNKAIFEGKKTLCFSHSLTD